VLLLSSYIFYACWDWRFLFLILVSSITDYLIGRSLYKQKKHGNRKILLILSIFVNIGILFFFKYFNFFIESFQNLLGISQESSWSSLNIILPVGISFYTFQTLSYTIDIYRKKIAPTYSVLTFFTFVAFFPQLVAGPIERASRLIPQFEKKIIFSYTKTTEGLKLILWGLFKKMVIADQLAIVVNTVYDTPENFSGIGILVTTILFGYQIYCDFSGYSDIAIGTAKLFGIDLMDNFKTPYFASSISDFWHRWHISLSSWFRDYVYIPFGGNKKGTFYWSRNILITFLISGLWHGANITFLLWGLIHGLVYIIERSISPTLKIGLKLKTVLGWIFTFLIVNLSWIFFRTESLEHLSLLFQNIGTEFWVSNWSISHFQTEYPDFKAPFSVLIYIFPLFLIFEKQMKQQSFSTFINTKPKTTRWITYYILILVILFFGVLNSAPQFIYFQF